MSTLMSQFHLNVHCPSCDKVMHVDEAIPSSITRIIMCEEQSCEHFGFAWTLNLLTGVGVSDRPSEEDATSESALTAPEFYRPPHPVTPGKKS